MAALTPLPRVGATGATPEQETQTTTTGEHHGRVHRRDHPLLACCDGDGPECNTLGDEQHDDPLDASKAAREHDKEWHQ